VPAFLFALPFSVYIGHVRMSATKENTLAAARRGALSAALWQELCDIAAEQGNELLHVENTGDRLRFFLDHAEGVTIEQCEIFSRQASAVLDLHDFGSGRYVLEVSSPGLDRRLFASKDYERFTGHQVRVRFEDPETRRRRTVIGLLESFSADSGGQLCIVDSESSEPLLIPLPHVEVARLVIEV